MSDDADIQWGEAKPESANKSKILYSSFWSEGVEYRLYDNVEVYDATHPDPHIGKIIKLWEEKESGMRRVLIRWFFKHKEVNPNLDGNPKELFLAFGKGKGVTNENDLEVICGKCKVLCTSRDLQNKQPSDIDLENADYFFSRIYNVDLGHFSPVQKVIDKLGCNVVYNKQEWVTENAKMGETADELLKTIVKCKKDVTLKQEPQSVGNSLPESNKRLRDPELASETQKRKSGQQSDFKKRQLSSDETVKSKKLKVSDAASSFPKKVVAKTGGTSAGKMKAVLQSNNRFQDASPLGDTVSNKTQTSNIEKSTPREVSTKPCGHLGLSSTKAEVEEEHSKIELSEFQTVHAPSRIKTKASDLENPILLGETSPVETTSPKVDTALDVLGHHAVSESADIESKLRQLHEKAGLNEADQNEAKAGPTDTQMLKEDSTKDTNSSKPAEGASGFMKEGAERRQVVKASENARPASSSKVEIEAAEGGLQEDHESSASRLNEKDQVKNNSKSLPGLGRSPKEYLMKEARSDVAKKLKITTGLDVQKKLMPTNEPVKAVERRNIFKELPWEENLQQGIPNGKVLLLQNFDSLVTSADIRDMLKSVFQGLSDARALPRETICPYGQALVIFESKMHADSALEEMETKCLVVMNNKRPIIASKVKDCLKVSRFPGHLALEKLKLSRNLQTEDYKRAVSTSHCSQPNTIEFEMAMEWRHLQEITQTCRAELFKKQRKEIDDIRRGNNKKG